MTEPAYGFIGLQDLYNTRVSEVGIERIFTAVQMSATEHNRQITALLSTFVQRTTTPMEQFELPGSGTLQPLDASGNPLPVKHSGSYQVAFPIQGGGTAWGANRVTAAAMTVEEVNRLTVQSMMADADWMKRHLMAAIFTNVTWLYNDEVGPNGSKGLGEITIQPLANADTVEYVMTGGASATDNHYLFQSDPIEDAHNPFPTIKAELSEHVSNKGPYVAYVATNLVSSIMGLTDFIEAKDPNVLKGANSDTLTSTISVGFGDEVIGYVAGVWIVEWRSLPNDYLIAHAQGGGPVLKMREYPFAELQGFFAENFSPDGNHKENRMIRYAGFGVSNRVAALVMQIGAGSYSVPTGYLAPLPV